jgi:hypothetical protein
MLWPNTYMKDTENLLTMSDKSGDVVHGIRAAVHQVRLVSALGHSLVTSEIIEHSYKRCERMKNKGPGGSEGLRKTCENVPAKRLKMRLGDTAQGSERQLHLPTTVGLSLVYYHSGSRESPWIIRNTWSMNS